MPTLKEFVVYVLNKNNLDGDPDVIIKKITEIVRKRAAGQLIVAISNEEVREMVINSAELSMKLAEEKKIKEQKLEEERRIKEEQRRQEAEEKKKEREAEKLQQKLEKERKAGDGEQLPLGLFFEND